MANRTKGTKTAAIREALAKSETGSPTEVAAELNKRGIKVTSAYVSTIKASDKRKALLNTRLGGTTPKERLKNASELMLQAVDLVLRAGGKEAKAMIEQAARIVEREK